MQTGDIIEFDRYTWRVLAIEKDRALLITETMVEQRPFHNKTGDVTWSCCELRNYLNTTFYGKFSEESKQRIIPVLTQTPKNPWYGTSGGDSIEDYIFLLSIEEVVMKYFGDSRSNLENRSPKQRYWFQKKDSNNDKRRSSYDGYVWWWWLRSPGRDQRRAVYIHGDGNIGIQGNGTFKYSSNTIHPLTRDNSGGVRPALWIKL